MKIHSFTTQNVKCGIADYANFLNNALREIGSEIETILLDKKRGFFDFIKLGRLANKADVVHIQHEFAFFGENFFKSALFFLFLVAQIKIPKVVTIHELALPQINKPLFKLRQFILFFIQRIAFLNIDLIFVHASVAKEILVKIGIPSNKIIVIMHPVPENKISSADMNFGRDIRSNLSDKIITIFGFVVNRKRYDTVFSIIKDLDGCILLIAGGQHPHDKSNYFEILKSEIQKMQIDNKVRMLGYIPEKNIPDIMNITDLVIAPIANSYGSGSLSFAIAYYKPILAPDIPYFKELRRNGAGIELYSNIDSEDLKKKIVDLIYNSEKQKELKKLNEQYAHMYNYHNTAQRIYKMYSEIIIRYPCLEHL